MTPQRVLVSALPYVVSSPARGDIVIVQLAKPSCDGQTTFIKRIVGMPGEVIAERDGTIEINGRPLLEPYIPAREHGHASFNPVALASNRYFVLGDNRVISCDSRTFGPIPKSSIRGEVIEEGDPIP